MKKLLLLLLKIAITTGLLWMIFREHQFVGEILPQMGRMLQNWPWTIGGLACVGISTWLGAIRWQVLLKGQKLAVPMREVVRISVASNFFNITSLGATGGDAYRLIALLPRRGMRRLAIVASIILDHIVGLVGLAILFLTCALAFRDQWGSYGREAQALIQAFGLFMAVSLFGVVLSVVSFSPKLYAWGEERWPVPLAWPTLKRFAQACDALRSAWGCSLLGVGLSILVFATHFLSFYFAIYAVGGAAPLLEVMAAMPIVDAAAGLPISVSGLGVREKTFETLMNALTGLPEATAVSASLAGWLMSVVWGLVGGLLFLRGGATTADTSVQPPEDV